MALELSVTDLKFGKGVGSSSGRYCPFVQITDTAGHVIGRSRIVADCLVHATWPCLAMSWDAIVDLQQSQHQEQQQPESAAQDLEEWVSQQPVLVALYDYQSNGNHVLLAKLVTSFAELFAKGVKYNAAAKTSGAEKAGITLAQLRKRKPSFTIDLVEHPNATAKLHVHQMKHSARGSVDRLAPHNFEASKQDLARFPELNKVSTPKALSARQHHD